MNTKFFERLSRNLFYKSKKIKYNHIVSHETIFNGQGIFFNMFHVKRVAKDAYIFYVSRETVEVLL